MRLGAATALVILAMLAGSSGAQAAQRYASPTGTGPASECPQADPCSLEDAIESANANDEVIVTAGSYSLPSAGAQTVMKGVYIHGDFGGPMPQVTFTSSGAAAIRAVGVGDRLAFVEVSATGSHPIGVECTTKGSIERVRVLAQGNNARSVFAYNDCLTRDSLFRADGSSSAALQVLGAFGDRTAPVRNVTAIATGPDSVGVTTSYGLGFKESGSETAELENVVAKGGGYDLRTFNVSFEGSARITASHSNYDTIKEDEGTTIADAGGNQSAPPVFVDPAAGDYREAAGSPTIDAGAADPLNGPLDLAGNPRVLGAAPDIGAYEVVPPVNPLAPLAQIQALAIAPNAFRAANIGGAIVSTGKKSAPVGATVTYSLSASGATEFTVERKTAGRKAKGRCVKKTRSNAGKKKCALFKPLKPGFSAAGAAGSNRFKFSGRIGSKPLKPGAYLLVGSVGGSTKRASFRIAE